MLIASRCRLIMRLKHNWLPSSNLTYASILWIFKSSCYRPVNREELCRAEVLQLIVQTSRLLFLRTHGFFLCDFLFLYSGVTCSCSWVKSFFASSCFWERDSSGSFPEAFISYFTILQHLVGERNLIFRTSFTLFYNWICKRCLASLTFNPSYEHINGQTVVVLPYFFGQGCWASPTYCTYLKVYSIQFESEVRGEMCNV